MGSLEPGSGFRILACRRRRRRRRRRRHRRRRRRRRRRRCRLGSMAYVALVFLFLGWGMGCEPILVSWYSIHTNRDVKINPPPPGRLCVLHLTAGRIMTIIPGPARLPWVAAGGGGGGGVMTATLNLKRPPNLKRLKP